MVVVVADRLAGRRRHAGEAIAARVFGTAAERPGPGRPGGADGLPLCAQAAAFDGALDARAPAAPRHDLDDGADRVGAEERALRAAHDLDALHVGDRQVREIIAPAEPV